MKLYQNKQNEIVTLTDRTATNKFGTKFLLVECANKALVMITESEFKKLFKAL